MSTVWFTLLLLGVAGPLYGYLLAAVARHRGCPERPTGRTDDLHVIFFVPCLNEGEVVGNTVQQLARVDGGLRVVVIDDASDDSTPTILEGVRGRRVLVTRRELPVARMGKGAALNHASDLVSAAAAAEDIDPDNVIVGILDADGELDADVLDAVLPWFLDPTVGAVQILVRIENRQQSLLARMQDVEFAAFIRVIQQGRNHLTSTGLGGNGQFTRLSALQQLGDEPWSDCLTEDLDLGVRLRLNGWRTVFDKTVAVHQQGLQSLRPLLRQRTRWFQGHLQTWSLLPRIWRSDLPVRARLDLSMQLFLPVMVLLLSVAIAASFIRLARVLVAGLGGAVGRLVDPSTPLLYLVAFVAAPLVAAAYRNVERPLPIRRIVLYAHLYSLYTWIWFFAGWRAVWRQFRGADAWVKTPRLAPMDATGDADVVDLRPQEPQEEASTGSSAVAAREREAS